MQRRLRGATYTSRPDDARTRNPAFARGRERMRGRAHLHLARRAALRRASRRHRGHAVVVGDQLRRCAVLVHRRLAASRNVARLQDRHDVRDRAKPRAGRVVCGGRDVRAGSTRPGLRRIVAAQHDHDARPDHHVLRSWRRRKIGHRDARIRTGPAHVRAAGHRHHVERANAHAAQPGARRSHDDGAGT